jgi:hypothetical protein
MKYSADEPLQNNLADSYRDSAFLGIRSEANPSHNIQSMDGPSEEGGVVQNNLTDKGLYNFTLKEIDTTNVDQFIQLLGNQSRKDFYSMAPAYFMMTGRKGLWVYGDDNTSLIIARHPNTDDEILFFPPMGAEKEDVVLAALSDNNCPKGRIRLARISDQDIDLANHFEKSGRGSYVAEDVLDWLYPVHILDVDAITMHKGSAFRDFRKNIYRAQARGLHAELIRSEKHYAHVINLSDEWASQQNDKPYQLSDLADPSQKAVSLLLNKAMKMDGIIIHEGSDVVGYILWEETDKVKGIANSVAGMSVRPRGTEEFAILSMCQILRERGFNQVCIGGSETEGLNNFKKKLCPRDSVALQSMILK